MELSVLSLPPGILKSLVFALESPSALQRDWHAVAEMIGFSTVHIRFIDAPHHGSSTGMVFTAWDRSGKSSVKKLIVALRLVGRIDCLRILEDEFQPYLKGESFQELYCLADRLKDNYAERKAFFPDLEDLTIGDDVWTTSQPQSPHHEYMPREQPLNRESYVQSSSAPALSPDEEHPPPSVTPCEATDVSPSRRGVFISYYPDSSTTKWVKRIAEQLVANGFKVEYASERQMADPDFKLMAARRSYNILVLCTQRYCTEDQQLLAQPGSQSKIACDRKIIRGIYFSEEQRIVCVGLNQDGPNYKRCVPDLYSARPFYEYPSQVKDLLHCVSDIPKFLPPEPVAMIPLAPKKISFQKEAKEWNARHGISSWDTEREENSRSGRSRAQCRDEAMVLLIKPLSLAPRKIHTSKTPFWKKLLPTAVK